MIIFDINYTEFEFQNSIKTMMKNQAHKNQVKMYIDKYSFFDGFK